MSATISIAPIPLRIKKRDQSYEPFKFDKISARIRKECWGLDDCVDPATIANDVLRKVKTYADISSTILDEAIVGHSYHEMNVHPDFAVLAFRIELSMLYKATKHVKSYSSSCEVLFRSVDKDGKPRPQITREVYEFVVANKERLDSEIIHSRDQMGDYFGLKTLEKSYLLRVNDKIVERPQHMYMRIAVALFNPNIEAVVKMYNIFSSRRGTLATRGYKIWERPERTRRAVFFSPLSTIP